MPPIDAILSQLVTVCCSVASAVIVAIVTRQTN